MFGIGKLDTQLKLMSGNIFNMILFDKLKTGDPIIDAIMTTIILTAITYLFQFINKYLTPFIELLQEFDFNSWFFKKSIVEYDGTISLTTNFYDSKLNQSSAFSDRFKALWQHIIDNISKNDTINYIKEYSFQNPTSIDDEKRDLGIYMVVQYDKFLISKEHEIYAFTTIRRELDEQDNKHSVNKNSKSSSKIEKITISLFSYKSDVTIIKEFVDKITNSYLLTIEDLRENKKFTYTLSKTKYENNKCEMWDEHVFSSTRYFHNLFFKNKDKVISKLDFFLKNKKWYFDKGIPYSLGIGMYGPPGTGKTSMIKAIANYTNRHVIVISLKLLKSKQQLDNVFFEERYNLDNKKSSINFENKIIVFEDIDCIGDIVMNREKKKQDSITGFGKKLDFNTLTTNSKIDVGDLLETIIATEKSTEKMCEFPKITPYEEPITLDDILNLWDGIRETPGRIMIISSNHYQDLDPALVRPGRIDLTLELSYASREIIKEIYEHLFEEPLEKTKLENINDNFYSPAEIINIYMNEERNKEQFIDRLSKNEHV
jgi:hypothetical protein